eukprot:m.422166 g.422166  ORF g.422166 m.422166 type:complete len:711 (+) comp21326_c0_seq1:111-2243(+)
MSSPCRAAVPVRETERMIHAPGSNVVSNKRMSSVMHDEETPTASGILGEHKHKRRRPEDDCTTMISQSSSTTTESALTTKTSSEDAGDRQKDSGVPSGDRTLIRKLEFANDKLKNSSDEEQVPSDASVTQKSKSLHPTIDSDGAVSALREDNVSTSRSDKTVDGNSRKASLSSHGTSCNTPIRRKDAPRRATRRGKMLTERQQLALAKKQSEEDAMLLHVNKRNASGETPLHQMVIKGNIELVSKLIDKGASVNTKDYAGWTPLHEACNHGYTDITALLLQHGANVNHPGCDGDTPMHDAAVNSHVDVVGALLSAGAKVNAKNRAGYTPLDVASDSKVVAKLLSAGARNGHKNKSRRAAATSAVAEKTTDTSPLEAQSGVATSGVMDMDNTANALAELTKTSYIVSPPHPTTAQRNKTAPPQASGSAVKRLAAATQGRGTKPGGRPTTTSDGKGVRKLSTPQKSKLATPPAKMRRTAPSPNPAAPPTHSLSTDGTPGGSRYVHTVPPAASPSALVRDGATQRTTAASTAAALQKGDSGIGMASITRRAASTRTDDAKHWPPLYKDFMIVTRDFTAVKLQHGLNAYMEALVIPRQIATDAARKEMFVAQARARRQTHVRMAAEFDKIRMGYEADVVRAYRAIQTKGSRHRNAVLGDIHTVFTDAIADAEHRLQCEIDALVAVQTLEWTEENECIFAQLPQLILPPRPVLLV